MEILFQDAHVVVAVKPCGVLSEAHESEPNMVTLLGGNVLAVHRLDRNVGGVMVYAKCKKAAAALSRAVQGDLLCKEYTAIVTGTPTPPSGELCDYLFKDSAKNKSFVVDRARKGAKEARLSYEVRDTLAVEGVTYSRVQVRLHTGRSHQIRVQFASRGWPLAGDGKYGSRVKAGVPALFASSLSFPHPQSGKMLHFSAPVPKGFPWDLFGSAAFEIERKFLIAYPDVEALAALPGCRIKRLVQTYLEAPEGVTRRVREIREEARVRFVETVKHRVSDIRAVEEERDLTEAEYAALLRQADQSRRPVAKTRYCIPCGAHVCEVDVYDFWQDRATAEVELAAEEEAFSLPPFLQVIREVTADKRYKNVNLARELPQD